MSNVAIKRKQIDAGNVAGGVAIGAGGTIALAKKFKKLFESKESKKKREINKKKEQERKKLLNDEPTASIDKKVKVKDKDIIGGDQATQRKRARKARLKRQQENKGKK